MLAFSFKSVDHSFVYQSAVRNFCISGGNPVVAEVCLQACILQWTKFV